MPTILQISLSKTSRGAGIDTNPATYQLGAISGLSRLTKGFPRFPRNPGRHLADNLTLAIQILVVPVDCTTIYDKN